MKKYDSVIRFEEASPKWTVAFQDYFNHVQTIERGAKGLTFSDLSLNEKETALNKLFAEELSARCGMTVPENFDACRRFATNPTVLYFADEIVDQTVDMILPDTLIQSIGMIADIRFGGFLDSFTFDIENNALFAVARSGRRQRNVPAQILENTTVTLAPVNREVTVVTNLPEILSGRKSIGKFIMKVMRSIETQMLYDCYDAFTTAMDAAPAGTLALTSYTENTLISLCERVTAYNQGRKAVIVGTPVALKTVLPSSSNARILLDSDYVTAGHIPVFNGYDVIPMSQVADYTSTTYGLKLKDNRIYVVSPASDKIMKVAVGGDTLSHTSGAYDKANLSMFGTVSKAWDVGAITNSVAGEVQLS
jgi:hypothetical protein